MRGNPVRYLLNYAGVDYEETTYIAGSGDWKAVKDTLGLDFPNLPYIMDGDLKMSETLAIFQYIATKYKPELLGGSDPKERANAIRIHTIVSDVFLNTLKGSFATDDPSVVAQSINESMEPIVKHLGENKFINGANLSIGDFVFFEFVEYRQKLNDNNWDVHPTLQAYH